MLYQKAVLCVPDNIINYINGSRIFDPKIRKMVKKFSFYFGKLGVQMGNLKAKKI